MTTTERHEIWKVADALQMDIRNASTKRRMNISEILDRLDRREYSDAESNDFMRSALIGLIDGATSEGHTADIHSTCFICQALAEMVAVEQIRRPRLARPQDAE